MRKKILISAICLILFSNMAIGESYLRGNSVNFADYRGKWVLINYWANWCESCYNEMPALNAFYEAHKNINVLLFGVNYDQAQPPKLIQNIQNIGAKFPTLTIDPKAQFGVDHINGLPTTLVIDPNGKLKTILLGEQTKESLEEAVGLR